MRLTDRGWLDHGRVQRFVGHIALQTIHGTFEEIPRCRRPCNRECRDRQPLRGSSRAKPDIACRQDFRDQNGQEVSE